MRRDCFTLCNTMCYSSLQATFRLPESIALTFFKMKQSKQNRPLEPQKVLAERINGWAAMLGIFAAVGAYLTTGQIIPGVV